MKTIFELNKKIEDDESYRQVFLNDPQKVLKEYGSSPPINDKRVFMTIVWIVAAVLLLSIIGIICEGVFPIRAQDHNGNEIILERGFEEFLKMLASTALGAIVGLLTPSPAA